MKTKISNFVEKIKACLQKLPEFSQKNFKLATYVCGALLSLSSIFFIYEMFTVEDFGFDVNWNIFKSAWMMPLYVVGIILAIVNWGKFGHWSAKPVYKDEDGNIYRNDDVVDNTFAQFLLPILGHFVFEPLVYACIIYYPVVCVLALLSAILPYVLALFILAVSVFVFLCSKYVMEVRYRSTVLVLVTVLMTTLLTWSAVNMETGKVNEPVYMEEVCEDVVEVQAEGMENVEEANSMEASETPAAE